jgi:hypothetical protein
MKGLKMKKVISVIMLTLVMVLAASPAFAADVPSQTVVTGVELTELKTTIDTIINTVFGLAALIAIVNIVYQGFKMISPTNPGAADGAKKAIFQTLIGLGIIFFARIIVGVVISLLPSM